MSPSQDFFRVKVFVDGRWISTGDFFVLEQAKERARLIAFLLERRVEIRDSAGEIVHREDVGSDDRSSNNLGEDSSRKTVTLD